MGRVIATAVYLIFLTGTVSGQPNKSSSTTQKQEQSQPPSRVANLENCNVTGAQTAKTDDNAPDRYTAIKRAIKQPDWWLVFIAFLTGCAIAYQAKEMTNATKEMRRNTDLQKAAYRQWLKVENWRADEPPPMGEDAQAVLVDIRFDILNPTKFPLTIRRIITQRQDATPLAPRPHYMSKRIAPDERHLYKATVCFERKAMEAYLEGRGFLFAMVGVSVGFEDVLGDRQEDTFGRYCWLRKSGENSFEPYEPGVIPETETQGEGKQAN